MSALIQSMDHFTPRQVGENRNIELGWSNDIMEKIVQLHFQLIRCKDHTDLENQYTQILNWFSGRENEFINEFCIVYKLAGFTRDIINGKGEQQLAFMLIWCQWNHYPELAIGTVRSLFLLEDTELNEIHPYGSWKDVKYLCNYIRDRSDNNTEHLIINYAINLAVERIKKDEVKFNSNQPISLVARWIPRETSKKFGWIFTKFAKNLYPHIIRTAANYDKMRQAVKKCKTLARKLLSKLNKYLDTTQIKIGKILNIIMLHLAL